MAKTSLAFVLLSVALSACSSAPSAPAPSPRAGDASTSASSGTSGDRLRRAIAHEGRSEADRARDRFRHPYETLTFFGLRPEHEVLELWSGGGWYTRILAPYLSERGKLHVTAYSLDSPKDYRRKMTQDLQAYLAARGYSDKVHVLLLDLEAIAFGFDGTLDAVLTFRNVHNWVKGDYDKEVYAQAYKALKPGGVFGVVEHRGPETMTRAQSAETGYMSQQQVIADIEAAGFTLAEASEINANPDDSKDHPKGVWTLPPSLRMGEVDKAKYRAIGESDRMTLKFIKPARSR